MSALLRREYGVDADALTDDDFFDLYAQYKYTEKRRYELMVSAGKQALAEVINKLFPETK